MDVVARLRALLNVAKCPDSNCVDGSIARQVAAGEWEQEQCQFCYERNDLLNGTPAPVDPTLATIIEAHVETIENLRDTNRNLRNQVDRFNAMQQWRSPPGVPPNGAVVMGIFPRGIFLTQWDGFYWRTVAGAVMHAPPTHWRVWAGPV